MTTADQERELARARERADLARMRFGNAVKGAVQRVAPERLKADALEVASDQFAQARQDLLKRLRYWPLLAVGTGLGAAALIFWRPARTIGSVGLRLAGLAWTTRDLWRPKSDRP